MFTVLVCMLMSTWLESNSASGEIKSNELVELAETARRNSSGCGPLAVWYTLGRLGHPTSVDELIASSDLNEQGTTVECLLKMLAERGCPGRAIRTHSNRLSLLPVPSILVVDKGTHCVVYDGMDDQRRVARIFETTNNEVRIVELSKLQQAWTGEAIVFERPYPSAYAFCAMCICAMSIIIAPVACLAIRRKSADNMHRGGFTLTELLLAIGIVGILLAAVLPAIQQGRESSRATQCRSNMHQIGVALHNYEVHFRVVPAAVAWRPAGEPLGQGIAAPGSIDRVSLGLVTSMQPDRVYANWAIALLPFLGEERLYGSFNLDAPIGAAVNENARATDLAIMICPSDSANIPAGHFQRTGLTAPDQGYARGNYAINAGTNRRCLTR